MNTKQKLTFLAVLFAGAGVAYAAMAGSTEKKMEEVKLTRMTALAAESEANAEAQAEADAEQSVRFKKMVEYRGDTPVVADFCLANHKWPSGGEHELDCQLTGLRDYHEIYMAGWKVTSVAHDEVMMPVSAHVKVGPDILFIERIGAELWKGQHIGFKQQ